MSGRTETEAKFDRITDLLMELGDEDGDFSGKADYNDPERPSGLYQVRIGGRLYNVDIYPTEQEAE